MTSRTALARIGKMVAAEVAEGHPGSASQLALKSIEAAPEMAANLIELIIKEGTKKRPDDDVIAAYGFLLTYRLEQLRFAVEREDTIAIKLAEILRTKLLDAGHNGRISPPLLLLVLHQFAAAKMEMGDPLRNLMQRLMNEDIESHAKVAAGEGSDHLARVAEELDGNTFAIHAYLDEHIEAMPEELRADILMASFNDTEPALREAVVGFLFSSSAAIRFKLSEMLELSAPHNLISPIMLRRMIGLRNWLPAEERPALDRAIKACRQEGVTCASWPNANAGKVFASFVDGSGAHSIVVIVREGRKHAVAALLAKLGAGIRDAWVKHETTDAELHEILCQFSAEAVISPSTLDYATAAARYFLAMNVAAGTMPPFGLLDFAETVGLSSLNPEAMSVERLIDTLSREIDNERLSSKGIVDALANSAHWSDEQPIFETWFEDTAEVRQLLAKRLPKTKLRKSFLSELLPERRQHWAELLAWSAFAEKHQPDGAAWEEMVVVAREVLGDRPLGDIPLMRTIADRTLAVHRQRSP